MTSPTWLMSEDGRPDRYVDADFLNRYFDQMDGTEQIQRLHSGVILITTPDHHKILFTPVKEQP